MQPIAFLTDQLSIRRILDHLGLGTSAQDKPPPAREILRVVEQGRVGAWFVGDLLMLMAASPLAGRRFQATSSRTSRAAPRPFDQFAHSFAQEG